MTEKILVTGGTGKTGRHVVEGLEACDVAPRVASREPSAPDQVRFEWKDESTYADAFRDIEAVYLVAPTDDVDSIGAMRPGLEAALAAGLGRFVLLSASSLKEGEAMMGGVHAWLREHAPEWVVLRPSWFMQNFSENQHLAPIRDENGIFTATGGGRAAFIDAEDIAASAVSQLLADRVANTDYIITGPEALSYDDVAQALSRHLERTITHHHLSPERLVERYRSLGFPADYAGTLAAMDVAISGGSEDRTTGNVEILTGRPPRSLDTFIQASRHVW